MSGPVCRSRLVLRRARRPGLAALPSGTASWSDLVPGVRGFRKGGERSHAATAFLATVEEKRKAYAALEAVLGEHAILCSNTSSLCITELAAATKRPDRFAGLHFFNPVPVMKLVEVIRALTTSDETYQTVFGFAQALEGRDVGKSDRIMLWAENSAEWVAVFFGCALRGVVVVPLRRNCPVHGPRDS